MKKSELRKMTVKELRDIVKDEGLTIPGAWKMKKNDLVEEVFSMICEAWNIENDETIVVEEPKKKSQRGRKIEVYKDGEKVKTLDSLVETFKWSTENKIANSGWVRESLRSGRETTPGRKYKEGGYLFKYIG